MLSARVAEKEKLTAAARMQLEHELRPQPPHIDREAIRGFLSGLHYPLYFLDFESFMPAIPRYDQSCVYSQIVFQYSLHIQPSPEAEPEHLEYLAPPGADPRRGVAERLLSDRRSGRLKPWASPARNAAPPSLRGSTGWAGRRPCGGSRSSVR